MLYRMQKSLIIKHAAVNAFFTALYVILIGSLGYYSRFMGIKEPSPFIPIGMLLLFVFSATVCGSLILGRPILWYIDGKKKEAVQLFGWTIGFFFLVGLIVLIAFLLFA